jgi:hypothetical protein
MRDYWIDYPKTGERRLVADVATRHIQEMLDWQRGDGTHTAVLTDTTVEAVVERLKIELIARSLG